MTHRFGVAAAMAMAAAIAQGSAQIKDAAGVLAAARQALGGDARLSAITSFSATGRTRQVRGENLVPIEFEITVELPDKYLRKDEIPAQESGPNASGFNGDELLQDPPQPAPPAPPPPPAGREGRGAAPGAPARSPSAARVTALKQDFARLALGMFASSFSAYPLTFTYAGQAEAPQGKGDVLDVKGPQGFAMRFFVNSETHLPIMVSWHGAPAGPGRGMRGPMPPPAIRGPQGGPEPGRGAERGGPAPTPSAPVENRLYFADYRDAGGGVQFPFRLRRAVGPDTIEETTFDRFRINPKIDSKKFEVRR